MDGEVIEKIKKKSWFRRNPKKTQFLSFIIGISLIIFMLIYTINEEAIEYIQGIDYITFCIWVFIALIVFFVSYFIRGFRWKLIMQTYSNEDFNPSFRSLSYYIIFGNFMNLILPFKLGDLTKSVVISKRENQKFINMFASVVLERIFDIFALGFLIIFPVYIFGMEFIFNEDLLLSIILIFILIGAVIISFFILIFKKDFVISLIGKILIILPLIKEREGFQVEIKNVFEQLNRILNSIFEDGKTIVSVIGSSILIWVLESLTAYFIALAIGIHINLPLIISGVIIGNLVKIMPVTPGGLGIYEVAFAFVLTLGGEITYLAYIVAVIDHLIKNMMLCIIVCSISISFGKIKKIKE